jgi:hypothetical protein
MGIDPGGTTGWACLQVPRLAIFGDEPPGITEWDYGELTGPEPKQAINIAELARTFQGLEYKTGPAILSEQWDQDPTFKSTDPEALSPARINAMLQLLQYQGKLNDATLTFQSRSLAKGSKATTDERLKKLGMYVPGSAHIRDATRHALIGLRRARESTSMASVLWPYPAGGRS